MFLIVLAILPILGGCVSRAQPPTAARRAPGEALPGGEPAVTRDARGPVAVATGAPRDVGLPSGQHTFALLLNGGGRREINYWSHLSHVREMVAVLRAHGVPDDHVTVFSGDGDDPAPDLAVREEQEERPNAWLFPAQGIGGLLGAPTTYVDSKVDGVALRIAHKDALRTWFAQEGTRLRSDDTLLFYVTDHGEKNDADLTNNTITLWGEKLSVTELRDLFARLDSGVTIVMLMSQCYTGAFARAIFGPHVKSGGGAETAEGVPAGNVCGYFASTADRPAYGCYPENRGKEGVGHSYNFIEALADLDRFPEAHRRVLVTDRTPDVPHSSTDFYLERLLHHAAEARGRDFRTLVDELLATAWQNRAAWEPEIRLLDRIGHTFGSFSPRSLAELEEQAGALSQFSDRLNTYGDRWRQTLESLKRENFSRFENAHPEWRPRLEPKQFESLDARARDAVGGELLSALVPFTDHDARNHARLIKLKQKAEDAGAARYRAEVRLGVVLRMRMVLTSVAGRVYIATQASPEERVAFTRLETCEAFALGNQPRAASAAVLAPPESFPPLAEEQRLVESLRPAYMGIYFRPLSETQRKRYRMERGAVTVLTVNPDSPAEAVGLQVGDIVLGPPGHPFTEPEQVREWTMWSEVGAPAPLEISRAGQTLRITLRPTGYPLALPELPGPPKVGSVAPPLKVDTFRGATELAEHKPRLLFFWATWCTICKHSLPEVLAFGNERGVEVVAITDEDAETLAPFFLTMHEPFPEIVATDSYRTTFRNYGVSGMPTFVLVDGEGIVRHYQAGYTAQKGLQIEGWKWQGAAR